MTTPAIQAALETLVDAIRAELRGEFLSVLGESAPSPKRRGPGRPKGSGRGSVVKAKRAKGAKRTPEELAALTTAVLAAVKKNPGSRVEELARIMGLPTSELALPMLKLREDRQIVKKGEKRAARYTAK